MRKAVVNVNFIAWTTALIGLSLKLALLAGGPILLLIGLGAAALCSAALAFLPNELPGLVDGRTFESAQPDFFVELLAPKVIFISSAVAIIGVLFRLMIWAGSTNLLLIGGGNLVVVSVVLLVKRVFRPYAFLLGIVAIALLCVSRKDMVKLFHRNDLVLVEKMNYQIDHPQDQAAAEAVRRHLLQRPASK